MIKIICLGKLKEIYLTETGLNELKKELEVLKLTDLTNDYLKRINKYHKIELIELKDEENLSNEAKNIMKYIGNKDYVITLEIEGKEIKSEDFAKLIDNTFNTNSIRVIYWFR